MIWQMQDAKNNFSKLVQQALQEGPQTVTLNGERMVVVVSAKEYDRLQQWKPTLVDHILSGPAWGDDIVEEINRRDKTPSREIEF